MTQVRKQPWKVILADDEPIIREGLREAVDWPSLQMIVVDEAEDGEHALELCLQHEADVVLADLNMPIMDGLTFIREIRQQRPACKVIIVTGHDEFAYAQAAVRLQVDDYLLKPVEPAQLRQVLQRVERSLEEEAAQEQHLQAASRQISRNFTLLRERFCLEWVDGQLGEEEIAQQLEFLKLPAEPPTLLGMIRWVDPGRSPQWMQEKDRQLFLFAIENIVSEYFAPYPHVLFRDPMELITLCAWGPVPEELSVRIEDSIRQYLKLQPMQHFRTVQGGLADLTDHYRSVKSCLYQDSGISPLARRARQHILEHYSSREISLERTAEELQVSSVYLTRMLKQELGLTFVSLLTRTRMQKAVQLLNATDLPMYEVAERIGYDSQHYFSTAFKKYMGVSPNQYRRGEISRDSAGETAVDTMGAETGED